LGVTITYDHFSKVVTDIKGTGAYEYFVADPGEQLLASLQACGVLQSAGAWF
jgi:hypothetical protein